jgi:hypothetical protein
VKQKARVWGACYKIPTRNPGGVINLMADDMSLELRGEVR